VSHNGEDHNYDMTSMIKDDEDDTMGVKNGYDENDGSDIDNGVDNNYDMTSMIRPQVEEDDTMGENDYDDIDIDSHRVVGYVEEGEEGSEGEDDKYFSLIERVEDKYNTDIELSPVISDDEHYTNFNEEVDVMKEDEEERDNGNFFKKGQKQDDGFNQIETEYNDDGCTDLNHLGSELGEMHTNHHAIDRELISNVDSREKYKSQASSHMTDELIHNRHDENEELQSHNENVVDVIIDDTDYPSGSDSATFVDRMDLADAYDDEMFTTDATIEDEEDPIIEDSNEPEVIITEEMKRCLIRQLGYTSQEVRQMKSHVAAVVVSKMLKRPRGGMPSEFCNNENVSQKGRAQLSTRRVWGIHHYNKKIGKAFIPTLVTGLSLYFGASSIIPLLVRKNDLANSSEISTSSVAETSETTEDLGRP